MVQEIWNLVELVVDGIMNTIASVWYRFLTYDTEPQLVHIFIPYLLQILATR